MKAATVNAQIYAEAADWLVEFRSGEIDAEGRKDFYRWLKASPEHMRAYLELAAIWNEGSALDRAGTYDEARLQQELEAQANITALPRATLGGSEEGSRSAAQSDEGRQLAKQTRKLRAVTRMRALMGRGALAAMAASLVAIIGLGVWYATIRNTYETGIGEERLIALADGSTIELNSNSRIRVEFSPGSRGVELLGGQALFHVAKNHARPFIVRTNNISIRAVGTQFDVYRNQAATTVTVVEGTVAVSPAGSAPSLEIGKSSENRQSNPPITGLEFAAGRAEMLLTAGEQVTVAPATTPKPVKTDVSAATSWSRHPLIFKGATLESVAEEFNRYNGRQIIIRDEQVSSLKVTGIFSSTDPASLIRFLEARSDLAVTESGNEIVVARKH